MSKTETLEALKENDQRRMNSVGASLVVVVIVLLVAVAFALSDSNKPTRDANEPGGIANPMPASR